MSLYNEPVPPKDGEEPTFPPLLKGFCLGNIDDLISKVIKKASLGSVGEVFYNEGNDLLNFAITLAPEVSLIKSSQMQHAFMVAVGDSIGALAPPEISVTYKFPGFILLNRGISGIVQIHYDFSLNSMKNKIPDWLIVEIKLRLNANFDKMPHDFRMENTSLAEEGAGFISRVRLIESICKHFLVWINKWEQEGFKSVHKMWVARHDKENKYMLKNNEKANWINLDEDGAGIFEINKKPTTIEIIHVNNYFDATI